MKSEVSPEPERNEVDAGVFDEVSQLKFNKISILYSVVNWIPTSERPGSFWTESCISLSVGWHHTKLEIIHTSSDPTPSHPYCGKQPQCIDKLLSNNCWIYFELLKLIKINYWWEINYRGNTAVTFIYFSLVGRNYYELVFMLFMLCYWVTELLCYTRYCQVLCSMVLTGAG